MKPRTVLSLEQALSLPSATLRFAQLGWRVIRIEATPTGAGPPGDPNRYIGKEIAGPDRHSYFIAPNVGKELIALNLKDPGGQEILHRLIRELEVDVFCCNTLPGRYQSFGIDYETLSAIRPELIWAGISAMGPDYPDVPGYDPATQAMAGFMETTGEADGPPTLSGIPIIDLKAGDEVFAHVCLALAERAESGAGKRIDVSMFQAAASWLITTLPLLDFDCEPEEVSRWGNAHRKFIPTNLYPTADGFIYLAMGSDRQWQRMVALEKFTSLNRDQWATNSGRYETRDELYAAIGEVTRQYPSAQIRADLAAAKIPNTVINTIPMVRDEEALQGHLTRTVTPDGHPVRMQPLAVETAGMTRELAFAPKYGEHTAALLAEAGYSSADVDGFASAGIIHV